MSSEKIAIIGSYGCGKTVLLSVLTHKYQKYTESGFQIRPMNQAAVTFCTKKWSNLEQGKWPAPTPPAPTPPIYRWEIIRGSKKKQIVTSDIAGEAWSSFITQQVESCEEKETKSILDSLKKQWDALPQKLAPKEIESHITTVQNLLKNASGIMLLLDLKQIINKEPGSDLAMFLPIALEQYMKHIHRAYVPITLVLSKVDEYQYEFDEAEGGLEEVVHKYIPYLPHLRTIISVSAVSNTKNNCPAPGFNSKGLDELCDNIWGIMSSSGLREKKRTFLRLLYLDLPILAGLFVVYLLLVIISPYAWICSVFFWISIVVYLLSRLYFFLTKPR